MIICGNRSVSEIENGCRDALEQIERKYYGTHLEEDGMKEIVKYGIAFYKKNCRVMAAE